jgi:hypothetical protein
MESAGTLEILTAEDESGRTPRKDEVSAPAWPDPLGRGWWSAGGGTRQLAQQFVGDTGELEAGAGRSAEGRLGKDGVLGGAHCRSMRSVVA